mgnify:CR=1 FL=1
MRASLKNTVVFTVITVPLQTAGSLVLAAVIAELSGGAILTNHCPNPKYRQFTLVKEAAE